MHELLLEDAAATTRLATRIAPYLAAGDVIGLTGGLGAGKSHFARSLISARLAACERYEDIPSPTYTLVQTYDLDGVELWHADLYRLGDMSEIVELGIEEAFATSIVVVEWMNRLGPDLPRRMLSIKLDFVEGMETARRAEVELLGPDWDWMAPILAEIGASP